MQRRILIRSVRGFLSPNEMAKHDHAPEPRPVQPALTETFPCIGDELVRQKSANNQLAQAFIDKVRQRTAHPLLHGKAKPALGRFRPPVAANRERLARAVLSPGRSAVSRRQGGRVNTRPIDDRETARVIRSETAILI